MTPWSPIARRAPYERDVKNRARVSGLCVHTTGSTLVAKAKAKSQAPLARALNTYATGNFPNYIADTNGDLVQVANDLEAAWTQGWTPWEMQAYRDDSWRRWWKPLTDPPDAPPRKTPDGFYQWWDSIWRPLGFTSPLAIIRAATGTDVDSPNFTHASVECIGVNPFTNEQVDAVARLYLDLAQRHGFGGLASHPCPQLLTHSDIGPCRRTDANGPWDPRPRQLGWERVKAAIEARADLAAWYPGAT